MSSDPADLLNNTSLPYPATTNTATALISNIPTTATLTSFSDKLLLIISQDGKLAQWFSVPLGSDNPSVSEGYMNLSSASFGADVDYEGASEDEDGLGRILVPQNRFVAKTLLGGGGGEREVLGGLLSRCVAGLVVGKNPGEDRVLVVGLGLVGVRVGMDGLGEEQDNQRRDVVLRVLELVSRVL